MSKRYKGAVISATPPTTSTSSASGVWTEQQFMQGVASGSWPALAGAPTIGTATAGALNASVAFTASTYTGSGITGYTATSSPGGITGTGASSPVTVSGLTAGTAYTFTVTATTAAGQSSASAASNSVTPTAPQYIEDVFNTYLWNGTGGQAGPFVTGVDLLNYGGLLWTKSRSNAYDHYLMDTVRGNGSILTTNNTAAAVSSPNCVNFYSNGFKDNFSYMGGTSQVSWTFREQAKFFDVVTYTGNGSARNISHNLGAVPGFMIIKDCTNAGSVWAVYHTSVGNTQFLQLQDTSAATTSSGYWNNTTPTSTEFTVGTNGNVNQSGATYVAYLFANNAGGFGLNGTDNVVSCGSYVGNASANGPTITLGYEPQWILIKLANSGGTYWYIIDNARGLALLGNGNSLYPNSAAYENQYWAANFVKISATGFQLVNSDSDVNGNGFTYTYVAIRRGPMKVPTVGTSVYNTVGGSGSDPAYVTGFPVDWALRRYPDAAQANKFYSRLVGQAYVNSASPAAEVSDANGEFDYPNAWFSNPDGAGYYSWAWQRAPKFFDVVTYTGNAVSGRQVPHNLTVAPELLIVKGRAYNTWVVAANMTATTYYELYFDSDQAAVTGAPLAYSSGSASFTAAPTSTTFGLGPYDAMNGSGKSYVAYMFATLAGVSKVGTYTGTGAVQTVNCGFTGGARFVMIKRTATAGNWILFDTTRGMVAGSDYYINPNLQDTQSNSNLVYTIATGFQVVSTNPALNATGESFFFLAIA